MTSVKITSYSDSSDTPLRTILVPTQIPQQGLSKRSALNLLTTTDLRLNEVLQASTFTNYQKLLILKGEITFVIAMSNIYFNNIDVRRDNVDLGKSTIFLFPINLGDMYVDMRNVILNITGTIFISIDPLNGYFENIQFDTYRLKDGFTFPINCNYPGADLINTIYFNNITGFTSNKRTLYSSPRLILYKGPGNFTWNNVNVLNYGTSYQDSTITSSFSTSSSCMPNDGVLQTIDFHNWALTMPNLPIGTNLLNGISIRSDYNLYRKSLSNVTDFSFKDFIPAFGTMILATGTYNQDIYLSNINVNNFSSLYSLISIYSFKKVIINGMTYDGWMNTYATSLVAAYSLYVEIHNINFNNYTYLVSPEVSALMSLLNIQITATIIDNVIVSNSNLHYAKSIYLLNQLNTLVLTNFKFLNISQNQGSSMIYSVGVQTLLFSNHTFTNIYSLDTADDSSTMLNIQSFDLAASSNSSISNIAITNSEISFLKFNGLKNIPSKPCYIMIQNMSFANSSFKSPKSLIDISNLENNVYLNIVLSFLRFDNISYTSKGNLLLLRQQIPIPLVVINSTFTNLISAGITIESSNKLNTVLTTNVIFQNNIFNGINDQTNSVIMVNEGGVVTINNWSFYNIFSYENGAVIYAGFQKSITTIYNSIFQNNTAVSGALFYIESQSKIVWSNWLLLNNFAISSGVAYAIDSGYFEFNNCTIQNNYALANPISLMFNGVTTSKLVMWTVSSNFGLNPDEINIELYISCSKLWFVPSLFKNYIQNNPKLLQIDQSKSLFQLISASMSISSLTKISNTNSLISSFISNVTISNTIIDSISIIEQSISATSSNLVLQSVSISNVINPNNYNFIEVQLESNFQLLSWSFVNSTSNLLNIRDSSLVINNFIFNNISSGLSEIVAVGWNQIDIENIVVAVSSTKTRLFFDISNSNNIILNKINITNIFDTLFSIDNSNVTQINELNILNWTKAFTLSKSTILSITNSLFDSNGGSSQKYGGALNILDSKVSIFNTSFSNNYAISGGAISYQCSSYDACYMLLNQISFYSNNASSQGGAIYYSYNRPIFQNVVYKNNNAAYGNNIASYAVKIRLNNKPNDIINFNNIASGASYDAFKLSLYDYDDQIMLLDNTSQISITPMNRTTISVKGTSQAISRAGVASFDNLVMIAKPGSTNIILNIDSKSIDSSKINKVFGSNSFNNIISTNFRFCMPGEIQMSDNSCTEWSSGTYSLQWNSTAWTSWLSNAQCLGGIQIYVDSGFWRRNSNSTKIVKCINPDAWLGNFIDQIESPVMWKEGYGGNLCSECQIINGTKYELVSDFSWNKWPDPAVNAIRVFGLGLLVFAFIMFTIILNIRKNKESQLSILIRILTTYLQLISTSMTFTVNYPTSITNVFSSFSNIGSSSDTFLSFDWFVTDYDIKGPFPSNKIFKLFLGALLPILLSLVFTIIWIIIYTVHRKWITDLKRWISISLITVLYFLHPKLAQSSISIFQWVKIDSNVLRVKDDINMECYSGGHIKWIFLIGFPILVVWVISVPIVALVLLYKNYNKTAENKIKQYFLMFYQGFKQDRFYWEFVNTLRKVMILMAFGLLSTFPDAYKIMISIIVLVVTLRIQIALEPYKAEWNNDIEIIGIMAGVVTISSGLIFSQSYSYGFLNLVFVVLVFLVNSWFLSKWLLLLWACLGERFKLFQQVSITKLHFYPSLTITN